MMIRINCDNPRSMYLFFARVQRVLSKNNGGVPPKGLWNELTELEHDVKNYYLCDTYLESNGKQHLPKTTKTKSNT